MANVVTAVTGSPSITQFGGKPSREDNIYPRARISYMDTATVAILGVGDTSTVRVIMDLPPNFAYSVDQVSATIAAGSAAGASNFENEAVMLFQWTEPAVVTDVVIPLHSNGSGPYGDGAAGEQKSWCPGHNFREVFWSRTTGSPVRVLMYFYNLAGSTAEQSFIYAVSFLQYDIRQAELVDVNAPLPVSVR